MTVAATILVVEDEPAVRELVVGVLRDEGYEVEEAEDGVEAIDVLDRRSPPAGQLNLVLLDMMLPQVDGVGVLEHLAGLGSYVPVVAMSASQERLKAAVAAGAQSTVSKPFDLDQLLDTVARYCGQTG